jgi:hypothetical protein
MNRAITMIAAAAMMSIGAQALAQDPVGPAKSPRRQLSQCMSKRMLSDRYVSYYEAAKICKAQLKALSENSPTRPLVAAGNGP